MKEKLSTLPYAERAVIEDLKISNYLLNLSHPIGRTKAQFFNKFGFSAQNKLEFAEFLKLQARTGVAFLTETTPYGSKYVVDGSVFTPTGKAITLRSVWMLKNEIPYLVTAYPIKK